MNFFLSKIDRKNIARCKKLNSLQFSSPVTLHSHLEIEGEKVIQNGVNGGCLLAKHIAVSNHTT